VTEIVVNESVPLQDYFDLAESVIEREESQESLAATLAHCIVELAWEVQRLAAEVEKWGTAANVYESQRDAAYAEVEGAG
jgi:hypothetical protein